jgi:hypothetical protein
MTNFFAHLAARYRGDGDALQPRVPFRFEPVSTPQAAAGPIEVAAWEPAPPPQRERPGPWARGEPGGADRLARPPRPGQATAARPGPPVVPARPRAPREQTASTPWVSTPPASTSPVSTAQVRPIQATGAQLTGALPTGTLPTGTRETSWTARVTGAAPTASAARERGTPSRWPRSGLDEPGPGDDPGAVGARRHPAVTLSPAPAPEGTDRQPAAAGPGRRRASGQDHAAMLVPGVPAPGGAENITVQVTIGRVEVRAAAPAPAERPASAPAAGPSLADYLKRKAGARP